MPSPRFEVPSGIIDGVNTAVKQCRRCLSVKSLVEFGKDKHKPGGLSIYCRACAAEKGRQWYASNRGKVLAQDAEKRHEWNGVKFDEPVTRVTAANRTIRLEVLERLGGRCACCGEDREEFLTLDHVNGGGRKHRAESGTYIFRRVRNDPRLAELYRVLCFNCNCSHGLRGYCPHERERLQRGESDNAKS